MKCENCGFEMSPNATFCTKCGTKKGEGRCAANTDDDLTKRLEELKDLHARGILNKEEYESKKNECLRTVLAENTSTAQPSGVESLKENEKKKKLKLAIIIAAAVIVVVVAAFGIWRLTRISMPNLVGKSVAQASVDMLNLTDKADEINDDDFVWNCSFLDEDGKAIELTYKQMDEKYEVYATSPEAGALMGKDDSYTFYVRKNAATIRAERTNAAQKLTKRWRNKFGVSKTSFKLDDDNNLLVIKCKADEKIADMEWKMEKQEQDTLDLYAQKRDCNVLNFVYSTDGYICAGYCALRPDITEEERSNLVSVACKKIKASKKVDTVKKAKNF